jgi:hypothetical protein
MIKNWNLFKESVESESKIRKICKYHKIENYTINDDFSINVDDNVQLYNKLKLKEIPLKFGNINGYFYCGDNYITSLEFGPKYVRGNFYCFSNKLTSLEHLPKYIGGDIYCSGNEIWSFIGIPDNFRELYCGGNPIYQIWNLFESPKDIEFFNDCHIVREPETPHSLPIVVIERLNFFLETIGKPTVEKVEGYINI